MPSSPDPANPAPEVANGLTPGQSVSPEIDKASDATGPGRNPWFPPTTQVFVGMLFAYLGLGMVVPIMAPLVLQLGLTEFQGGLIFAVNYLLWVLASPFWGGRTEMWGRKPIILLGLLGFSVGHLLFALTADIGLNGWLGGGGLLAALVASRALAGGLFSGAPPAAQAYVVDIVKPQDRTAAVGLLGAAAGIGTVAGPGVTLITSFVELPLTVPIYLAALMPLVPATILWFTLPSSVSRERKSPPTLLFWDKRFASILGVGLMMNVAFALVLFTLGFYIKHRLALDEHATAFKSAIAMALVGLVAFVVQAFIVRALRWSPVTLIRVGLVVMTVGMTQLIWTMHNEYLIYLAVVVIGAGYSLTYPGFQSAITFAVGEDEQGAVAGLAAGAGAVAFIIGPVLGTWMYGIMWESPYILSAVLLSGTAVFAMFSGSMKRLRRVSKGLDPAP